MKVKDVMTSDVQTVRPDQPVQQAASFMLSADAGSIPVTDGERLVGMITDRDIAVRGVAKGYGPDTPVRELMSDGIICARADDDVEEAATKMSEAKYGAFQSSTMRNFCAGSSASATSAAKPTRIAPGMLLRA